MSTRHLRKWTAFLFLVLLINTAYIAAFNSPTVFYMGNVLLHLVLGVVLTVALLFLLRQFSPSAGFFLVAAALGLYLAVRGNTTDQRWALTAHIVAAAIGLVAFAPFAMRQTPAFRKAFQVALALLVVLPLSTALYRRAFPDSSARIRNPLTVPTSMEGEGGGPKSPFFPSSARTNVGGIIPSNFFMDSERCGECHKDIYQQWKSSMHHFASFNNQFYRKSIEYMQSVVGTKPSKWCAGCHDHAVFFTGRFDKPMI